MKTPVVLLFLLIFLNISCNSNKTNPTDTIVLGDTIQTESGLQYYYLKQGDGRQIASGSKVSTYLSLKIKDSVVWTSANDTDSLFTFIMGGTTLIKGFNEAALLLRQGDEIVAIIPDSLGYGDGGSGSVVPPNATLIYDKFKVVNVEEPRSFLADTLVAIVKSKGTPKAIEKYHNITTTADSTDYHQGITELYNFWEKLNDERMHQEAFDMTAYLSSVTNNNSWMRYCMVQSLDSLGQTQRAIDSLKELVVDKPKAKFLKETLEELQEKVAADSD